MSYGQQANVPGVEDDKAANDWRKEQNSLGQSVEELQQKFARSAEEGLPASILRFRSKLLIKDGPGLIEEI